jgi:hypothetical protein
MLALIFFSKYCPQEALNSANTLTARDLLLLTKEFELCKTTV